MLQTSLPRASCSTLIKTQPAAPVLSHKERPDQLSAAAANRRPCDVTPSNQPSPTNGSAPAAARGCPDFPVPCRVAITQRPRERPLRHRLTRWGRRRHPHTHANAHRAPGGDPTRGRGRRRSVRRQCRMSMTVIRACNLLSTSVTCQQQSPPVTAPRRRPFSPGRRSQHA